MQLLVYLIAYPFLWFLSKLPFRVVYFFSDVAFFWVYTVFGYRKKVVRSNLQLVFPEKSRGEIDDIMKKFYRHLCDVMLETVKPMAMTKEEMAKRFTVTNIGVLQKLETEKSIIIPISHYANWEWSSSINDQLKSTGYAVYQKIGNPYFDRLIKSIRAKWNTTLISQPETVKTVVKNEQMGTKGVYGMVSDQSPQMSRAQYFSEFMGVRVPIHYGPETLARKYDLAVVFLKVSKLKRGYYQAEFIPITTSGKDTSPSEITEAYLRLTEQQIREQPEYYLWTHRRWKHQGKERILPRKNL